MSACQAYPNAAPWSIGSAPIDGCFMPCQTTVTRSWLRPPAVASWLRCELAKDRTLICVPRRASQAGANGATAPSPGPRPTHRGSKGVQGPGRQLPIPAGGGVRSEEQQLPQPGPQPQPGLVWRIPREHRHEPAASPGKQHALPEREVECN